MSGIKAEKLSDEVLEHVGGGTNTEMMKLQELLGVSNLMGVNKGLKELGIKAKLSSYDANQYTDLKTGSSLSQEDVLSRIRSGV